MLLCNEDPQCKEAARVCGGVATLLSLLRSEVAAFEAARPAAEVPTKAAYLAGCLASLVARSPRNQQALFEAGGIQLLLRALGACRSSPEAATNLSAALADAVHHFTPALQTASAGVGEILASLAKHPGSAGVQTNACRLVATLTDHTPERNEENRRACAENRRA